MIGPATPEGTLFEGRVHHMSIERLLAFSGGPFTLNHWPARNLHIDPEKAAEAGFPAPVASGLQAQGHIIRLLIDLLGDAWSRTGSFHSRFRRPVFAGDSIQAKARLAARRAEAGVTQYTFDVWCERHDGEIAVVGTAACTVHEPNPGVQAA
ncbi:MAG: MaoC family dehydratase [Betaproteobacteria bacterium]|nr:MaoC family dehydratase [Betaproteobacteria bacterium]